MKKILFFAFFFVFLFLFNENLSTKNHIKLTNKSELVEAVVDDIIEEKKITFDNLKDKQIYQKIKLLALTGTIKGKEIILENNYFPTTKSKTYKKGERVLVSFEKNQRNKEFFYIVDYVRTDVIAFLFISFVFLSILITGKQGGYSFFGMIISFFTIFYFILPQILQGKNPLIITIIGLSITIPITFSISHGVNKKSLIATTATLLTLIISGLLTSFSIEAAKLTGFSSEEANFIQLINQGKINIKDLLLAGIIISLLGVLDDITISQSSIVFQLNKLNPKLKIIDLYQKAMEVGKDHISALINTLVLVYTGNSLPLLIILINTNQSPLYTINYEIVTQEIVKTLIASIGLILAVPITTIIASVFCKMRIFISK